MNKKSFLLIILMVLMGNALHGIELTGALNTHDPSRIVKDSTRYWFYMTGNGIPMSFSENLTSWRMSIWTVFPAGTWPDWINTAVPGFGGNFWAPDLIYMNNAYYCYYSCSTWGSSRSAIGVAKSPSLDHPEWTDLGMVVSSDGTSTAINAIDPGLFRDDDGKIYMVYGSWFGGIGIVEIDSVTGKATTGTTHLYGGGHQSIEAANLIKEGSYYYLIINRGNCCQGVNSTYYIVATRSENVLGPYSESKNILMTDGRYIGPGHFSPLYDSCASYASIHYYDGNAGGTSKLDILRLLFADEWPVLTRDFTFENCGATGFEEYNAFVDSRDIKVFPNPVESDQFSITLPDEFNNGEVTVEIYRLDGKLLYRKSYSGIKSVMPHIEPGKGTYIIRVTNGGRSYTQKLVIQ
ncbi:MAG: family 43 glycosylhydrolase [Bacteroidales bacterium]|nr:family 43 glycosylhydrolase [Bacteroidales bacterium]MBN2762734.1 family 43 glycosylhydrolase [Bacteroidales bacterium]